MIKKKEKIGSRAATVFPMEPTPSPAEGSTPEATKKYWRDFNRKRYLENSTYRHEQQKRARDRYWKLKKEKIRQAQGGTS